MDPLVGCVRPHAPRSLTLVAAEGTLRPMANIPVYAVHVKPCAQDAPREAQALPTAFPLGKGTHFGLARVCALTTG